MKTAVSKGFANEGSRIIRSLILGLQNAKKFQVPRERDNYLKSMAYEEIKIGKIIAPLLSNLFIGENLIWQIIW